MTRRLRDLGQPKYLINKINTFLEKDSNSSWNTVPPVAVEKVKNVNCHKFVLYAIGKISWEEMVSYPAEQQAKNIDFTFGEKIRSISDIPYTFIESKESLVVLAQKNCEIGKIYVGQILDAQTEEMGHSFILRRESEDEYICFDKPGFKYPFTVCDLDTILNFVNKYGELSNKNQKWRFVLLESIKKSENADNLKED